MLSHHCEEGWHHLCHTLYPHNLGYAHCICVCHDNPVHLASTCPVLRQKEDNDNRDDT